MFIMVKLLELGPAGARMARLGRLIEFPHGPVNG